jgi:formate-dependent nitrite reductase membrane component NrfD
VTAPDTGRDQSAAGRSVADAARTSYYEVPVVHAPHWGWLIICYFFLGGLAAGSYVLASIADLVGGVDGRRIVRAGRYVSVAALLPCPALLVLDLGRPLWFHHMLRVVKLRSPMSAGVWGLLAFSGCCGLSAVLQAARDGWLGGRTVARARLVPLDRALGVVGTGPAFFLGSYTGVLLAATAVPLWARSYLLVGPLFLTSALSSGTAAITVVLALARGTPPATLRRLERFHLVALLADLGLLLAMRAHLGRRLARPLETGRIGLLFRGGVLGAGLLAPLAIQGWAAARGRESRALSALASALVLAGGFLLRYVMVNAGRRSADDPRATYEFAGSDQDVALSA